MANPNPQHNPTDGLGTAAKIALTSTAGAAINTIVAGRQYTTALSLSGTDTTTLTATIQDIGGNTFTTGNGNSVTWKSYNTSQATVAAGVVTGVAKGQALIEAQFPTFDSTDGNDFIYVQLLVTVGA